MFAADANILVRLLACEEDEESARQTAAAKRFLDAASAGVFIGDIAIVECAGVLMKWFRLSRAQIAAGVEALLRDPRLVVGSHERIKNALAIYRAGGGVEFADCVILAESRARGKELRTFDKKLARKPGASLLPI